jgi:hypothetical protein
MSATYCPFDNELCAVKELRFSAIQNAILQSGGAIQITPGAFDGCPEIANGCDRYTNNMVIPQIKSNGR